MLLRVATVIDDRRLVLELLEELEISTKLLASSDEDLAAKECLDSRRLCRCIGTVWGIIRSWP